MKIDRKYQLHKLTETVSKSRFILKGVHVKKGVAQSSSGWALAQVPCVPDELDKDDVIIPEKLFKEASPKNKQERIIDLCSRAMTLDKTWKPQYSDYIDGAYPNTEGVKPTADNYQVVVMFDAKNLLALAQALGADTGGSVSVKLEVPMIRNKDGTVTADTSAVIKVTTPHSPQAYGLLMPVRE